MLYESISFQLGHQLVMCYSWFFAPFGHNGKVLSIFQKLFEFLNR